MGGSQNSGPLWGPLNTKVLSYIKDSKRNHNLDNHPYTAQKGTPFEPWGRRQAPAALDSCSAFSSAHRATSKARALGFP